MNPKVRDKFEGKCDSQVDFLQSERFTTFVMTAYVDSCGANGPKPLSKWLSSRCFATDYEASNADVLCDQFIYQECQEDEDNIEALESFTGLEIGRALAGDWDLACLNFAANHQERDVDWFAAAPKLDAIHEREEFHRHLQEMEAYCETNQDGLIDLIVESPENELPPDKGSKSEPLIDEESLDEAKARWDRAIGMTSQSIGRQRFVYCSPNGFPLIDMELNLNTTGRFDASFGHPIAMQNDWLNASMP